MKLLFSLVCSLCLLSVSAQDGLAVASEEPINEVAFDLENKEGVVTLQYSSELPEDIELIFLTPSGSVLWSKMLFGFEGKAKEKLEYLVPEGNYVTRVLYGDNEITKRISLKQ